MGSTQSPHFRLIILSSKLCMMADAPNLVYLARLAFAKYLVILGEGAISQDYIHYSDNQHFSYNYHIKVTMHTQHTWYTCNYQLINILQKYLVVPKT